MGKRTRHALPWGSIQNLKLFHGFSRKAMPEKILAAVAYALQDILDKCKPRHGGPELAIQRQMDKAHEGARLAAGAAQSVKAPRRIRWPDDDLPPERGH